MLGRLVSGSFVPATPTPFTSRSLGKYLKWLFERTQAWRAHAMDYWAHAQYAVEVLLGEASRPGHGATTVILDANSQEAARAYYSPKYKLYGEQRLGPRIEQCAQQGLEHVDILINLAHRELALETVQRVAQLAAVDGALVLNTNFEVLAFGAELKAQRWQGMTKIGPDGFGGSSDCPFDVSRYGTRHNSALNFAGAFADCVVFVISQDGPIRAFVRDDDSTILCWPDCSESMFLLDTLAYAART